MNYHTFIAGELMVNCYLLWSDNEAGLIDPGGPLPELPRLLAENGLALKWILNTHGHFDHISGNAALKMQYDVPLLIQARDRLMLTSSAENLSTYCGTSIVSPDADRNLQEGDQLQLGNEILQVIETPGHTPGGISLFIPGMVISGDTLFFESVGRTDLPGGNHRQLMDSIKGKLLSLDPETTVLPGHGPATTIGHEKNFNPFI